MNDQCMPGLCSFWWVEVLLFQSGGWKVLEHEIKHRLPEDNLKMRLKPIMINNVGNQYK